MKFILSILLIFYSILCFSQISNINRIDSMGHKQGLWIELDSLDIEGYSVSEQIIPDSTGNSDNEREIISKYEIIKHKGKYIDDKKNGLWEVFRSNNKLWMKIEYCNGQRLKIEIFYTNMKPLYICEKSDSISFNIKEYSKKGILIKKKKKSIDFVNKINESKLFILGY